MFTRSSPLALSSSANSGSSTPLVVSEMPQMSGMARIMATRSGRPCAHQRLAAGESDLADAGLHGHPHEEGHVLVGQDLFVGLERLSFGRHAVDTPVVAPVCDGEPKIVDFLAQRGVHPHAFLDHPAEASKRSERYTSASIRCSTRSARPEKSSRANCGTG